MSNALELADAEAAVRRARYFRDEARGRVDAAQVEFRKALLRTPR